MKDIEIAKKLLEKEGHALVAVKSGKLLFTSNEKGIKPMYILAKEMKDICKGASIADKVIGRGAVLLSTYLKIAQVHGQLMSKEGIEILKRENINYTYDIVCDHIQNRDKTDLCPIEKLSLGIDSPTIFIEKLESFFKSK